MKPSELRAGPMGQLERFVKPFYIPVKGARCNVGSLHGGKWLIPHSKYQLFIDLFATASPFFTESCHPGYVFRPPKTVLQPYCLDIDLKTEKRIPLPQNNFIEMASLVAKELLQRKPALDKVQFKVVTKQCGYFKKVKGKNVFATGAHIYFSGTRVDLHCSQSLMSFAVERVPAVFKDIPYINSADDVVDERIPLRKNGLMFISDFKPTKGLKTTGGRYEVRAEGVVRKDGVTTHILKPGEFMNTLRKTLHDTLSFVFENPDPNYTDRHESVLATRRGRRLVVEPAKKPIKMITKVHPTTLVKKEPVTFDLNYFLSVTSQIGSNDDWLQLVYYCRRAGLDRSYVCDMLNKKYNPEWLGENFNVWDSYKEGRVNKGSIIRLLQLYADKPVDDRLVFPGRQYRYHNESMMFDNPDKSWHPAEIEQFCRDVYGFTWGGGDTEFIYQERVKKRFGSKYFNTVKTVITSDMPFQKDKNAKLLQVEPSLDDLQKEVSKIAKEKLPRYNQQEQVEVLQRINTARALVETFKEGDRKKQYHSYLTLKKFLAQDMPESKERDLGLLFKKFKQRGGLVRKYHSYTVEPFLTKDLTPPDCLNIFPGFECLRFANDGDITKTAIYHWMWVCWANRSQHKLDWLLNYFARKLQMPHLKVKKFLIAFSRLKGSGKSSVRAFLSAVYGEDKVMFCDTIEDFMSNENSEQLHKLFVIIDDLERAGRKLSNDLKSKITSHTFKWKELYKNKRTMPDFCDLIGTSNSRNCVFVGEDDRRNELVEVNPEMKPDKAFWTRLYKEFDTPNIVGAWFHYLANYKITMDVSDHDVRFDEATLQKHKHKNMKVVHRFVLDFFTEPDCFETASKNPRFEHNWFGQLKFFKHLGERCVFVSQKRLFRYFVHWKELQGLKTQCKMSTFKEDLSDIGFTQIRRVVDEVKLTGYVFMKRYVTKSLRSFYKLDPFDISWCWDNEKEFSKYETRTWRFLHSGPF